MTEGHQETEEWNEEVQGDNTGRGVTAQLPAVKITELQRDI